MDYVVRYENRSSELAHHGIIGQKWGVRRFQNSDGSLTDAGRKRYGVNIERAEKNLEKAVSDKKEKHLSRSERKRSSLLVDYAKEDLHAEKVLDAINKNGGLTDHQKKLAENNKKRGMSDKEAAVAAYQTDRVQKALLAVGGVTVTAAAAYGVYKYKDYISDDILKTGMDAFRVSPTDTVGVHDGFYAAFGKKDPNKYIGLYGNQLLKTQKLRGQTPNIYQKKIKILSDMKIASDKNARDIFKKYVDGLSDSERKKVESFIAENVSPFAFLTPAGKTTLKGASDMASGKVTKAAYEAFNIAMAGKTSDPVVKNFVKELATHGYSGVKDVNDRKYSGFNAKTAKIIFDSSKVAVESVRNIPMSEVENIKRKELMNNLTKSSVWTVPYASVWYGVKRMNDSFDKDIIVEDYKKEHPKTKMTYNEIVRKHELGEL